MRTKLSTSAKLLNCTINIFLGEVELTNEVEIQNCNRWPNGLNEWTGLKKTKARSFFIESCRKGAVIGQKAVMTMLASEFSVKAKTDCVMVKDSLRYGFVYNVTHMILIMCSYSSTVVCG